jgi:hypothetical protein
MPRNLPGIAADRAGRGLNDKICNSWIVVPVIEGEKTCCYVLSAHAAPFCSIR